jgi:molybdopterin molybdotransferase
VIPLQEAQRYVLSRCDRLPPDWLPLDIALGCVTASAVVATEPVPAFVNSSMDGYAVRAVDTRGAPVTLSVVGVIMAGAVFEGKVGCQEAARIMTGAPLPAGADAVCMVEDTVTDPDEHVTIGHRVEPGQFVRQPGRDVAAGDLLAPIGTVLSPAHLGVLANQGVEQVLVYPRPRVGVLSTGDELFSGPGPLPPARIRDGNRQTLLALARQEGWHTYDLGAVGDDEADLVEVLTGEAASACDAVITSGGVSMGDLDLVRVVLEKLGDESTRWMQVAIRPAKPFAFTTLTCSGTRVFGLPGNPVSAMVSFELCVRPAVRKLGGHRDLHHPVISARAQGDLLRNPDGKLHLLRGRLTMDRGGAWSAHTADAQESHQLRAMADANALILVPDGEGIQAGERVEALLIDPARCWASLPGRCRLLSPSR